MQLCYGVLESAKDPAAVLYVMSLIVFYQGRHGAVRILVQNEELVHDINRDVEHARFSSI